MKKILPPGKLNPDLLGRLLKKYRLLDKRVIIGPEIGEDAAVIDFREKYLVVKTDPITFVSSEIGWYLVQINANDLATMGATPKWLLATVLLPEKKATPKMCEEILSQIYFASRELKISLCGGHTEITPHLTRPILVGQMLGEVEKDKLVHTSGAKVGDDILLTKGIAIEGTSVIAREKKEILERKFSRKFLARCKDYLHNPGISVLKEALLANRKVKVHSMHDPTEGGLAMGLYEVSKAAGVGIEIEPGKVRIYPESQLLGREFNLTPLGLIASGALIFTLDPGEGKKLLKIYKKKGIECSVIGKVVEKKKGLNLPYFEQDELSRILTN
jgi:hydrogenase maturation factor